jgi:hypothetical protein
VLERSPDPGDEDEIRELRKAGRKTLKELIDKDRPVFLANTQDELILFDHLQPCLEGRFTGRYLLPLIQQAMLGNSESESLRDDKHYLSGNEAPDAHLTPSVSPTAMPSG